MKMLFFVLDSKVLLYVDIKRQFNFEEQTDVWILYKLIHAYY